MLDAPQLALTTLIMLLGSTVLTTVGFGIGVTTTPLLLLYLDPQAVVILVNLVATLLSGMVVVQTRGYLPAREMVPVTLAGAVGALVGVYVLVFLSQSTLRIAMTVLILLLTLSLGLRVPWPQNPPRITGPVLGFVVGVLLASLAVGGPLLVLLMVARKWARQAIRASMSVYFLVVHGLAVAGYGVAGIFTTEIATLILIVTPAVIVGFGIATLLVRRMNEAVFRRVVLAVITVASLMVLGRELLGLQGPV